MYLQELIDRLQKERNEFVERHKKEPIVFDMDYTWRSEYGLTIKVNSESKHGVSNGKDTIIKILTI